MRTLTILVSIMLIAASPSRTQNPENVADGVYVLTVSNQVGDPQWNMGLVEFRDHLLVIDPASSESWTRVAARISEFSNKPVRFSIHTSGNARDDEPDYPPHLTRLVVLPEEAAVWDGKIAFSTDAVIGAGDRTGKLIQTVGDESAVSFFLPAEGILFAGDMVGSGRGADPPLIRDWIAALERIERLNPRIVVPGSGTLGNIALVRNTRLALAELEAFVASSVDEGRTKDQVLASISPSIRDSLPAGTVERAFDEYVGILPATRFINTLGLKEGTSPTASDSGWTRPTKVVVADLWPGKTARLAHAAPGVGVVVVDDPQHAAQEVHDADAILGWLTPDILDRAERLRWVALYSAGVERYLAIPGFSTSDIVLTNGQRLYAAGGAEHVLGMVLSLARRFPTATTLQRARRWDSSPLTGATPVKGAGSELVELRGRTMLVAGLGGIGTEVARLASGIGMRVLATRASRREGPPFVEYVGLSDELITLTAEADVIVNCLPLTPQTEQTFGEQFFESTKPSAYFINIGRGKTVDTEALTRALQDGRIAGAGLDVTEPEPLPADHDLWDMPNVMITPHVGGDSDAHMQRIWLLFRENLRRFAAGEPLLSVVDKQRGY